MRPSNPPANSCEIQKLTPAKSFRSKSPVSAVSIANALQNLYAEVPVGIVDPKGGQRRKNWTAFEPRIQIEGSPEPPKTFLPSLIDACWCRICTDVNGEYRGF